ncbi:MAG TPA: hypothetical protein VGT03_09150 [Candidatus Acidoferrales bacterium]|nr:hypothetical protein [Candidatus Acidoferrales bacterium]
MPGAGVHRFYFEGKTPIAFWVAADLLFANTIFLLALTFGAKYFLPVASGNTLACEELTQNGVHYHAPSAICWYATHSILIQFILLGLVALVLAIYWKRVRYYGPKS